MLFALRALFAPPSPAIMVPDLATPQVEIATVADAGTCILTHSQSTSAGDTAYDVGIYALRLSTRTGMVDDTGKYIVMLERTGGNWKIATPSTTAIGRR